MPDDKKKKSRDASANNPMVQPSSRERFLGNAREKDVYLNPNMPKDNPVMRAATPKERIGDFFSELMNSVAEQPLVRGLSKANELLNPPPPPGFKIGMMPGSPGSALGKALAPNVKMMHPSVPPEFHAVERARMPQARTAPIDMNDLPSGKMEFLDPDIAEYMKAGVPDLATREGQQRLQVLKYLTGKR